MKHFDFTGCRVMVIGDLMLDKYLSGSVQRLSPEAPVPVLLREDERAVLGGAANVCANLAALGAEVVAIGTKGERRIAIGSFFTGPFETSLKPDEILVEIRIPQPAARSGGAYLKLERKVGDFATAAVAVQLTLAANGACDQVGIGLTNVGLTSIKATKAEAALTGNAPDEAAIKQAAELAAEASEPSADLRGSVEYKKDLVRVLTARALRRALERAQR